MDRLKHKLNHQLIFNPIAEYHASWERKKTFTYQQSRLFVGKIQNFKPTKVNYSMVLHAQSHGIILYELMT